MSAFSAWAIAILGVVIIGITVDLLMPSGKMEKPIRSFFAALTLLIIITPLPSLINNGFNVDIDFSGQSYYDTEYLDYVNGLKADYAANSMQQTLKSKGYSGFTCAVKLKDNLEIESISIKIDANGIYCNGEHINRQVLTNAIAEIFSISEDSISYE